MSKLLQKVPDKNLNLLLNYAKLLYGVIFLILGLETGLWFYKGVKPNLCYRRLSDTQLALLVPDTLEKPITQLRQLSLLNPQSNCGLKVGYLWLSILLPLCLVFCPKEEGENFD